MLRDQDGAGQPEERGGFGEHTDDVGVSFDLLVHPFQRVRRPDLPQVPVRERREREKIVAGLVERDGDLRVGAFQHRGDLPKLAVDVVPVGPGEDRTNDRRDHVLGSFRDDKEHIAHEMHPASPLVSCAGSSFH